MVTPDSSSTSARYGLAIHTASSDLGFAISNFADDQRCQIWALGRDVSNYLHLYLNRFLQPQTWSDLAFIAVAKGPGGFTGTRLGVVTARTLAQQLDLPVFAISTLAAVAWSEGMARNRADLPEAVDIAVQMPAHRGEIYGAIYRISRISRISSASPSANLTAPFADAVLSPDQWQQILKTWDRPYQLAQADHHLGATTEHLLALAHQDWQLGLRPHWSAALPFYGQSPV
jgi:tRNA threonylcarbamoyl adenosine modification protein YeaZ